MPGCYGYLCRLAYTVIMYTAADNLYLATMVITAAHSLVMFSCYGYCCGLVVLGYFSYCCRLAVHGCYGYCRGLVVSSCCGFYFIRLAVAVCFCYCCTLSVLLPTVCCYGYCCTLALWWLVGRSIDATPLPSIWSPPGSHTQPVSRPLREGAL